jgi:hypothetical protein
MENPFKLYTESWSGENIELNSDVSFYSSLDDAIYNKNPWTQCEYRQNYVKDYGFPGECGPSATVSGQESGSSSGG